MNEAIGASAEIVSWARKNLSLLTLIRASLACWPRVEGGGMQTYPSGELLIGGVERMGAGPMLRAFDPSAEAVLEPAFGGATLEDVAQACQCADAAFDLFRATAPAARAAFLEAIAANLEAEAEALVARAGAETGLAEARLRGELRRTTGQLRLFACVLRDGDHLDARIDHALPERMPPRADIRLMNHAIGPVVVFGASNFPLAFSVAGGDTASALAAGCPVIVKAHPAHPGTSELAGRAIQRAISACGLPAGVFALLFDAGTEIGAALVADPRIQAVGFTGSRHGGLALVALAQTRPRPIPVYAEMSSLNPVVLLPGALAERGEATGKAFAAALTLAAGQFCTNPGLVLALDEPNLESFIAGACGALTDAEPETMLSVGIHSAYRAGVEALANHPAVTQIFEGPRAKGLAGPSALFSVSAAAVLADARLTEEVFGASSMLVRCRDLDELLRLLRSLEGQLTVAVHAATSDLPQARELMPTLERLAGRVLFNGFGTGVEVCDAMVHGGPFPATSDGRSTSVGSLAIARFLRPVCYQDVPSALLPAMLREDYSPRIPRRIDGVR